LSATWDGKIDGSEIYLQSLFFSRYLGIMTEDRTQMAENRRQMEKGLWEAGRRKVERIGVRSGEKTDDGRQRDMISDSGMK